MSLPQRPPASFREPVLEVELELRGEHASAFQFPGGVRDPSRAVICLSGMGANGRSFARQKPLSAGHFLLLLNTTPETPEGLDPVQFAADEVEKLIALEGLERPVLLGSSFGGAVAMTVAVRRPERLGGVVLANPVLARTLVPLASPKFLGLIEAPRPLAELMSPLAVEIMGGFSLDRDARDEIVREARCFTLAELRRRLEALLRMDLLPHARGLGLPLLWVHGGRDWLVPWRRASEASAFLGARRFELIEPAGHLPYLSHPKEFNAAVEEFLGRVRGWEGTRSG